MRQGEDGRKAYCGGGVAADAAEEPSGSAREGENAFND
jgi:hypothetical protein